MHNMIRVFFFGKGGEQFRRYGREEKRVYVDGVAQYMRVR